MDVRLPAHAAIETVSSLSRMPEEKRISAELVLEALRRDFPKAWLALSAAEDAHRGGATDGVAESLVVSWWD